MARLLAQDISYADRAPVIAERAGLVSGTPQEVWDAILDYERWPTWFPSLLTCRATSDPATGVGSTREVTLPGKARVAERFIVWDEPEVWAFTATEAPIAFRSLVERITLRAVDEATTEVTYRMAIGPQRFLGPLFALAKGKIEGNLAEALRGLNTEVIRRRGEAPGTHE